MSTRVAKAPSSLSRHAVHHHLHHHFHHCRVSGHAFAGAGHARHAGHTAHGHRPGPGSHFLHHGHAVLHRLHVIGHQGLSLSGCFGVHHFLVHRLHGFHAGLHAG